MATNDTTAQDSGVRVLVAEDNPAGARIYRPFACNRWL